MGRRSAALKAAAAVAAAAAEKGAEDGSSSVDADWHLPIQYVFLLFLVFMYIRYRFTGRVFDFAPEPVADGGRKSIRRQSLLRRTASSKRGLPPVPVAAQPIFRVPSTSRSLRMSLADAQRPDTAGGPEPSAMIAIDGRSVWDSVAQYWDVPDETDAMSSPPPAQSPILGERAASESDADKQREARKVRVCEEIVATELRYADQLHLLVKHFARPLKEKLDRQDWESLFANIETLCVFHRVLAAELGNAGDAATFAHIFLAHSGDFIKLYPAYVANYDNCIFTINRLGGAVLSKYTNHASTRVPELENKDITAFLVTPIQRVPRYELLFKELRKHTAEGSNECGLVSRALEVIHSIVVDINERKRQVENMMAILNVQNRVKELPKDKKLLRSHRLFIQDGVLIRLKEGKKKKYHFFLFNDILLWTNTSDVYKGVLALASCVVKPIADKSLEILDPPANVTLVFAKQPERDSWLDAICTSVLWSRANRFPCFGPSEDQFTLKLNLDVDKKTRSNTRTSSDAKPANFDTIAALAAMPLKRTYSDPLSPTAAAMEAVPNMRRANSDPAASNAACPPPISPKPNVTLVAGVLSPRAPAPPPGPPPGRPPPSPRS